MPMPHPDPHMPQTTEEARDAFLLASMQYADSPSPVPFMVMTRLAFLLQDMAVAEADQRAERQGRGNGR